MCSQSLRSPALLLLILAACGGDGGGDGGGALHREERLKLQRSGLNRARSIMADSALEPQVLASIESLLVERRDWVPLDGWGLSRLSLTSHLRWSRPGPDRDVPRAVDIEDPKHPFHAICDHARQLRAHGVELLVVAVPTRLEVWPDRLPGVVMDPDEENPADNSRGRFEGHGPATNSFLAALVQAQVEVLDLLGSFAAARSEDGSDPLFFRNDNHWTPRGAELCAQGIVAHLRRMPGWNRGPARQGQEFEVRMEPADVPLYGKHEPAPERVTLRRVLDQQGEPAHQLDRTSPLLLLGDSFTFQLREQGSDLASLLYAESGLRLDAITFSSGADRVWQALARRRDGLAGKRWVVWVFTSRALELKQFKTFDLFQGQ